MNIFELKIWDDERKLCTFYTVQYDGDDTSETDKFILHLENSEHDDALGELLTYILEVLGDIHGAQPCFFNRYEHEVVGLPHKGELAIKDIKYHLPHFPLRLYALRVNDHIVILFGGGVKDGPTNQSSSLHLQWVEACSMAKKIWDELKSDGIKIDEKNRKLTDADGNDSITIY